MLPLGGSQPPGAGAGGPPPGAPDLQALAAAAGPPPQGAAGKGVPHPPLKGDHTDNLAIALKALQSFQNDETDPQDISEIAKAMMLIHKVQADNQSLEDKATGAGPGARLVRKATGNAGGGPGY